MRLNWPAIMFALVCMVAARAEAEPRIALVIGNAQYDEKLGALATPDDDARLMTDTLRTLGFTVMTVADVDQKRMKRAIATFGMNLAEAGLAATPIRQHPVPRHGTARNNTVPMSKR